MSVGSKGDAVAAVGHMDGHTAPTVATPGIPLVKAMRRLRATRAVRTVMSSRETAPLMSRVTGSAVAVRRF